MAARITLNDWVNIALQYTEEGTARAPENHVRGFVFRGYYLSQWLEHANSGLYYEDTYYQWCGQENFTSLFRDTFGIDPNRTGLSRNNEVIYYFTLIFKKSHYFKTYNKDKLFDALINTEFYKNIVTN